jgi:hypothetical protein
MQHSRVLADALFDHFETELQRHPDLKPLQTVWKNWLGNEAEIARDASEAATMRALMKALLLWKIAGAAPSVAQLANAVALDARLPGDGNYEYCQILLEKMRMQGSGIALERREGEFADRYTLMSAHVSVKWPVASRTMCCTRCRRTIGRIATYASAVLPRRSVALAALQNAALDPVMWRNVPRGVAQSTLRLHHKRNAGQPIGDAGEFGRQMTWLLCIVPPFGEATKMYY